MAGIEPVGSIDPIRPAQSPAGQLSNADLVNVLVNTYRTGEKLNEAVENSLDMDLINEETVKGNWVLCGKYASDAVKLVPGIQRADFDASAVDAATKRKLSELFLRSDIHVKIMNRFYASLAKAIVNTYEILTDRKLSDAAQKTLGNDLVITQTTSCMAFAMEALKLVPNIQKQGFNKLAVTFATRRKLRELFLRSDIYSVIMSYSSTTYAKPEEFKHISRNDEMYNVAKYLFLQVHNWPERGYIHDNLRFAPALDLKYLVAGNEPLVYGWEPDKMRPASVTGYEINGLGIGWRPVGQVFLYSGLDLTSKDYRINDKIEEGSSSLGNLTKTTWNNELVLPNYPLEFLRHLWSRGISRKPSSFKGDYISEMLIFKYAHEKGDNTWAIPNMINPSRKYTSDNLGIYSTLGASTQWGVYTKREKGVYSPIGDAWFNYDRRSVGWKGVYWLEGETFKFKLGFNHEDGVYNTDTISGALTGESGDPINQNERHQGPDDGSAASSGRETRDEVFNQGSIEFGYLRGIKIGPVSLRPLTLTFEGTTKDQERFEQQSDRTFKLNTKIAGVVGLTLGYSNIINAVPEIRSYSTGDQQTNRFFGSAFFDLIGAGSMAAYKEPSMVRGGIEVNAYWQSDPGHTDRNASGVGVALRICAGGGSRKTKAVNRTNYPTVFKMVAAEAPNSQDLIEATLEREYQKKAGKGGLLRDDMSRRPLRDDEIGAKPQRDQKPAAQPKQLDPFQPATEAQKKPAYREEQTRRNGITVKDVEKLMASSQQPSLEQVIDTIRGKVFRFISGMPKLENLEAFDRMIGLVKANNIQKIMVTIYDKGDNNDLREQRDTFIRNKLFELSIHNADLKFESTSDPNLIGSIKLEVGE